MLLGGFTEVTPSPAASPRGDGLAATRAAAVDGIERVELVGGARAQVQVRVDFPADWRLPGGDLYALPAGARGTDDYEALPYADWEAGDEGQVVLNLPDSGPWDIVLSTKSGTAAARSVRTPEGLRTPVVLAWPRMGRMTLRLSDRWPALLRKGYVKLAITDAAQDTLPEYPGAEERGRIEHACRLAPGAVHRTVSLPQGRYRLDGHLRDADSKPLSRDLPRGHMGFLLVPTQMVHPGSRPVELRVVEAAKLDVEPVIAEDTPIHWGAWRPSLLLRVTDAYGRVDEEEYDLELDAGTTRVYGNAFRLPPGAVSVAWAGRGVQPGRLQGVALMPGARKQVRPRLQWDREVSAPAAPRRLPALQVVGHEGETLTIAAMLAGGDDEADAWERDLDVENGLLQLPTEYGRSTSILVYREMAEASWPIRTDLPTPKPIRLYPAGHLVIVPMVAVDPALGGLRIRRKDGGPVTSCRVDGGELKGGSAYRALDAEPGVVVGPLPEGEHVFEVRLGKRRLPDAKATVRAGRVEVLRISW